MHICLATNYDSGNWILLARQKECLVEKKKKKKHWFVSQEAHCKMFTF